MRVLVCGGREFGDRKLLHDTLDNLTIQPTIVIHGAARGADSLAAAWAYEKGIPTWPFPADWEQFGRSAGIKRNLQMLAQGNPDLVVAFPGGRGTQHMVDTASYRGFPVKEIHVEDN